MSAAPNIHSIATFLSGFQGGTRPNRFKISVQTPAAENGSATPLAGFIPDTLCQAASIPQSTVGYINIPFRGRVIKFPGDRVYDDWTVTMFDDTGSNSVWQTWHDWSNSLNDHINNKAQDRTHKKFFRSIIVEHLDHASDKAMKKVVLSNAWPVSVGPINLDMSQANQLAGFQCQIAYTHWEKYEYKDPNDAKTSTTTGGAGAGTANQ